MPALLSEVGYRWLNGDLWFSLVMTVMTNSSPEMALIEIDGLPFLKMVDLSMAMLVITRG